MPQLDYAQVVLANAICSPEFTSFTYVSGWQEQYLCNPLSPDMRDPITCLSEGGTVMLDFGGSDVVKQYPQADDVLVLKGGQIKRVRFDRVPVGSKTFDLFKEFQEEPDVVGEYDVRKPHSFVEMEEDGFDSDGDPIKVKVDYPILRSPDGLLFVAKGWVGELLFSGFKNKAGQVKEFLWRPIYSSVKSASSRLEDFQKQFDARNSKNQAQVRDFCEKRLNWNLQSQLLNGQVIKPAALAMMKSGRNMTFRGFDIRLV
jgi:hypothetical protein